MLFSIVQWGAEIGVFSAILNAEHLKLKYHWSICFLESCHLYVMGCLTLPLLMFAGYTELNPGLKNKEILVMFFHCFMGILTVLLLLISRN